MALALRRNRPAHDPSVAYRRGHPLGRSRNGRRLPRRMTKQARAQTEETTVVIRLTANGKTFTGSLDDTPAARDLLAMLPLSLTFADLAGEEKWARLPNSLDVTGAPEGSDGQAGGIYHYVPWQNLALFYGDHGFADGLVKLGRLDDDAVAFLASAPQHLDLTIEAAD